MARRIVVAALSVLALGAGRADAQEPPALEPPIEATADAPPTPPPAEPVKTPEPAPSRPLLVIPGVTAPLATRAARKPTADVAAPPAPPALDGPSTDPEPAPNIPLRLEPIAPGASDERQAAPSGPRATGPGREASSRPMPEGREPAATAPPAARRPAGLGRLLGANGSGPAARDGLTIESHGDPAVEAAVKRRIEKQIQETLGERVKDVDVRVSGRSVLVRARASRFWYRWSARRALDALPMPSGYRGRAEMLD
ncbi:hypothetical protein [Paludisphaera mucosa]|uniref:Uncharacterized protein n=1 Tax=Paludisphaera mucosa TaxID=3030827 RepID=A0ABT6FB84_9BACT|nr:hypothetical protein [Paludisphaera mucosa]MDG3004806.1 hypothetical protein [Paludisphaera mucosa]